MEISKVYENFMVCAPIYSIIPFFKLQILLKLLKFEMS